MDNTTKTTEVNTTEETTAKTYTQEEVDALLQRESDKRVTEALKKAEKKNQDKVKEAQRLAQMNEQEKYEYQLKQREEAIATHKDLKVKQLPVIFVEEDKKKYLKYKIKQLKRKILSFIGIKKYKIKDK